MFPIAPRLALRALVLGTLPLLAAALPATPQQSHGLRGARGPEREVVEFKLSWPDAGDDVAVFLLGDLPELGGGDLVQALEMVSADATIWRVQVSLPVDREYTCQYYLRSTLTPDLGDPSNGIPIGEQIVGRTRSTVQGPGQKRMQVHSTLVEPQLHWRQDAGDYQVEPLEFLGAGRAEGELRFGASAFGIGRRPVEFFLTSLDGTGRDPADDSETYTTPLDELFLQDGELFTYVPAPVVEPMHRNYGASPLTIHSDILGVDRTYRVMLPRGYAQHLDRRYPVLYHYDGLHVWDQAWAPFGLWDPDGNRMAQLVASGEVGEMIQVAIDYVAEPCFELNRVKDCVSPEDVVDILGCGRRRGMADVFLSFVVSELKPIVDATYRTLPDRQHTFATGFSLGGVLALYAGWEFTDTFGAIGAQSGSFWIPRFPARVRNEQRPGLRVYLDTGDQGGDASSILGPTRRLRRSFLLTEQRALERDLRFAIGYGQGHTFTNGGLRMAEMLTFLWPAMREVPQVPWP
jgi:enterochelin esterase-like enzyme